jgi:hypothetical protein
LADPEKVDGNEEEAKPASKAEVDRHSRQASKAFLIQGLAFFIVCAIGLFAIKDNRHLIHKQAQLSKQHVADRNFNIQYVCNAINKRIIIPDRLIFKQSLKQTDLFLKALGFGPDKIEAYKKSVAPLNKKYLENKTPLPCNRLPIKPKHKINEKGRTIPTQTSTDKSK